jgi:hypothetical protein
MKHETEKSELSIILCERTKPLLIVCQWFPILRHDKNYRIGKVNFLDHTEIPDVFFTSHHGRWRHHGNQGNIKCNYGMKFNNFNNGT